MMKKWMALLIALLVLLSASALAGEALTVSYLGDGTVQAAWQNHEGEQPWEVRYLLKQSDLAEDDLTAHGSIGYSSVACTGTACVLDKLVPGEDYWVGAFDSNGQGAYQAYDAPEAAPYTAVEPALLCWPMLRMGGSESKVAAFTQAQAADTGAECGVFLGLQYRNPGKACQPMVQIVLELPDGQKLVMYTATANFQAKAEDVTGWNFISVSPYFAFLQEKLGEVPVGEYHITVYLDGDLAGSAPLEVQPSAVQTGKLDIESFTPQADGSVLVKWSGGTAPYAVLYTLQQSDSFDADMSKGYQADVLDCMQTAYVLEDLVPGESYWIIVSDAESKGRYRVYMPSAAQQAADITARLAMHPMAVQGESKMELPFLPPETAGLQDETEHGAFIRFHYDNPGEARTAVFRMVFELPESGPQVVFRQTVNLLSGTGNWFGWEFCSMEDYLSRLRWQHGRIPSGEIRVNIYLDNALAATSTLPVGMDW